MANEGTIKNNKKQMPSHRVFVARSYEKGGEEKTAWTEIGVIFPNKAGFTIELHAVPVDGRCIALPYEERGAGGEAG